MIMGNLKFEELALHKAQNEAGFAGAHVPEKNLSKSQQKKRKKATPNNSEKEQQETIFFFFFGMGRRNGEGGERGGGGGADQLGVNAVVADPGHGEIGSEEAANRITGMK